MSLFLPELERQLREAIRQRSTQAAAVPRRERPRWLQRRAPVGAIALRSRSEEPNHVSVPAVRAGVRVTWGRAATVLAAVSAVMVALVAIALLGHGPRRGTSATRTVGRPPGRSLDAQLAHGVHPLAPAALLKMPILGRTGTEDLADLRGKVVVVNVFASWCAPCAAEEPVLEQTQKQIVGRDATILGVTYLDTAPDAERFVTAHRITYPVLRDVGGDFARAYGASGIPETYVINRQGQVTAIRRYEITRGWLANALAALAIATPARAAPKQRASLTNIEPDVMCVACHQPLERAHTPPAVAERRYISSLVAKGETKAQIENALVRQYGPAVLAKSRTTHRPR